VISTETKIQDEALFSLRSVWGRVNQGKWWRERKRERFHGDPLCPNHPCMGYSDKGCTQRERREMMKSEEMVTERGEGKWGDYQVDFVLSTVTCAWTTRSGEKTIRSPDRFRLTFRLVNGPPDWREFETAAKRETFLKTSIEDRRTLATPPPFKVFGKNPPLIDLVGEELAGVSFVRDYVQLVFAETRANFYEWPLVHKKDHFLSMGETGYRDALCSLINQEVRAVDVYLDAGVVVSFSEGELSLPPELIRSSKFPEIVVTRNDSVFSQMEPFQ
jgi:hypothetical protein